MGRPRDEELNRKIVEAATDEFHAVGYGAMTLSSVASRANVSPQPVYTRFRDKPDLLKAIIKNILNDSAYALKGKTTDDPYNDLLDGIKKLQKLFQTPNALTIPALTLVHFDDNSDARKVIREEFNGKHPVRTLLFPLVVRCKDEGLIAKDVSVSFVVNMIVGFFFCAGLGVDPEDWESDIPKRILETLDIHPKK